MFPLLVPPPSSAISREALDPPPAPPAMETLRQRHPDQVPIHLSNGVAYLWESRGTSGTCPFQY